MPMYCHRDTSDSRSGHGKVRGDAVFKRGERLTENGDQVEVINFLSDPGSYSAKPERVDRLETHGALVFLAGEEAWKIKRAVRFPYMDFSTLEKRQIAAAREIEINQWHAPEIYIGLTPITRGNDGHLEFSGSGEIVEWAVRMRRFEQTDILSHVADAESISTALAMAIADVVLESHQAATPVLGDNGAQRIQHLVTLVTTTLTSVQDSFEPAEVQRFGQRAADALGSIASVLNARASAGFVRRCHGDLHLNNMVLWRGRPVLFDAIEFNEELATIDTLYDLAFLLMDLDIRAQRRAANTVLNRCLSRSGADLDLQGLQTLPLFLGLRAVIRAAVTAERSEQKAGGTATHDRGTAQNFLKAANSYLMPPAPRLIAVGGLSGTGKSTLARALAPELGPAPG